MALAIETMPPLLMASARFLVAGGLLYAVLRLGKRAARPSRREWTAAIVTSAPLLVVGNGGVAWGVQTVPTGVAALMIASVALWITLLDRIVFGRRLAWPAILGLGLGFAGVALLVDPTHAHTDVGGTIVLLCAALGWATGSLLTRSAGLPSNALLAAAMQMLAGGVLIGIVGVAIG